MAIKKWDLLSTEQQTAGLVGPLNAEYWGWFDMVNANFLLADDGYRPIAMTIPEGIEQGKYPERWTAWKFPDDHVRVCRPYLLEIVDFEVDFPPDLECGCFPHTDSMNWCLIRESDKAMAQIVRSREDVVHLTSLAVQ